MKGNLLKNLPNGKLFRMAGARYQYRNDVIAARRAKPRNFLESRGETACLFGFAADLRLLRVCRSFGVSLRRMRSGPKSVATALPRGAAADQLDLTGSVVAFLPAIVPKVSAGPSVLPAPQ
jgi:hypothetical protein